jgi:hypothetical protein
MLEDARFIIMPTNSTQDKSHNKKDSSTSKYEKCYLTTAMREFKLTKWQIECALSDGVLQQLNVPNPHYKSGPFAIMLYRAEIEQNLNRLRSYPRFSAAELQANKVKRTVAKDIKKARDEIEFFCETCQTTIRAPNGYPPFEWYCQGKIPKERALKLLRRHHVRHWHTNFDEVYKRRALRNLRAGMEWEEAEIEAKAYAERMTKQQNRP